MPARVERYDAATQLVDVSPQVKEPFENEDGSVSSLQLPIITNVPLVFPGAGGFHVTFPVAVGDTVLVVFADRSIDTWLAEGGLADPVDQRRHSLSDAIAIPGLHSNKAAISGVDAAVITLGKDSESADFVALSTKVKNEITALRNTVDAALTLIKTHVHVVTGTAAAVSVALAPMQNPATVGDVASASVKIKG